MTTHLLAGLKSFLLDMDGTVYLGAQPLPGAHQFIAYLRATGRRHLFLTNNPTRTAAAYAQKLHGLGIDAEPGDILTAGEATAHYLATQTAYRCVYAVGTPSFLAELHAAGIDTEGPAPEAVVLAFDTTLTYAKLEAATHYVNAGLPYLATNPDWVCPAERGPIPDCGAIAALLEKATGRWPEFIGKPNAAFAHSALEKLGADPASTAMVGDRLYTDIAMAHRAGIVPILVLSGEAQAADLSGAEFQPAYIFAHLGELLHALRTADQA